MCIWTGLCQGEVVGCIVWWVGLHPAQVITIQSIAFLEKLTNNWINTTQFPNRYWTAGHILHFKNLEAQHPTKMSKNVYNSNRMLSCPSILNSHICLMWNLALFSWTQSYYFVGWMATDGAQVNFAFCPLVEAIVLHVNIHFWHRLMEKKH